MFKVNAEEIRKELEEKMAKLKEVGYQLGKIGGKDKEIKKWQKACKIHMINIQMDNDIEEEEWYTNPLNPASPLYSSDDDD